MFKEMIEEYKYLYPNKTKFIFARACLCYWRVLNFRALVLIRKYMNCGNKICKKRIFRVLLCKYGIEIGLNCKIGKGLRIEHCNGIVIGNEAVIGNDCVIYHQVTLGQKDDEYPIIGNNVILYPGCKIIGGISVGDNCIIGTNAVVLSDVPDNCIAVGIPAIVKSKG